MKIAILADIHANAEALEAVLSAADKAGAGRVIVLGDVVGYGADSAACIRRLREARVTCVLGNHDQALVDCRQARSLNSLARDAIIRSRDMVTAPDLDYLRSFAYRHVSYGGAFSHANPIKPEEWRHMLLLPDMVWCLARQDWRIAFVGHTHHPGIYCAREEAQVAELTSTEVAIGRHRYLINPGSVGQPRDGDWRASFGLWDLNRQYYKLHRVEYPVQQTQRKIREAGWPYYLADRLSKGE